MKSSIQPILFPLLFICFFFCTTRLQAQIINGPWIDTLYRENLTNGTWPTNFLRFNLDGLIGPAPYGSNAWEVTTGITDPGNYYISHPYFFSQSVRNNRWFVLPEISLSSNSYELLWKSRGLGSGTAGNGGFKIFVCQNCPTISTGNVESVFTNQIFQLSNEEGQDFPGPYFYQNRSISLNSLRNKTIRIAFQNTDSALGNVRLKDFIIRSKPLYDLLALDILGPDLRCNLKANENIRVAIRNQGGTSATGFVVSLFKNGALQEAKTVGGNIAADQNDTLVFANVNMQPPGNYRFRVKIDYLSDTLHFNDTLSRSYEHRATVNLASNGWKDEFQNFDPKMYKILDLDQDGYKWGWNKSQFPNQETGEMWYQVVQHLTNTSGGQMDWLLGGCLQVEKDSLYQLGLDWKIKYWQNQGMTFQVFLGYEPRVDSMKLLPGFAIRQGQERRRIDYTSFKATRTGTLFFGLKSHFGGGFVNQAQFSKIQVNKRRNYDLALNSIYQPGDSTFTCAGSGQKIIFVAQNLGKQAFVNPTFEVSIKRPDGSEVYFPFSHVGSLAPGERKRITVDSLIDFSMVGSHKVQIIHQSLADEEKVNDTITGTQKIYAAKPPGFVDTFDSGMPGWWIKPGDYFLGFQNLSQTFYGGGSYKRELLAVSNIYSGLPSYAIMQVDLKFESTSAGNFLTNGDTLDFLVSVNCGPFIRLRRLGPGIQVPTGFNPFFVDLASLNLQPTDRVNFMFRATFAGLFQGLNYSIYYDNLRISSVAPFDASVQNPVWYPYSLVTSKHRPNFIPSFRVVNSGFQTLNPVTNRCQITPAGYNEVINTGIGMNATQGQTIGFPSFTPLAIDSFSIKYSVQTVASQPDAVPENNLAERSFQLSDSTLARDYGPSTKRLGFTGNSSRGMLGQIFTLQTEDTLTSISVYFDTLTAQIKVKPVLYACNPTTGIPNNFVLDSNFATTTWGTNRQRSWQTISLRRASEQNRGVALPAGKYFIGLIQKQGFMSLGYNEITAEKRTVYRRNSAASGNVWSLVDTVGQVLVRANFGPKLLVANPSLISKNSNRLKIYPNPAENELWVENENATGKEMVLIYNNLGQLVMQTQTNQSLTKINIAKLAAGLYRLKMGNQNRSFVKE